ncbi:MAG TPA: methyltransferase, partial [Xanthomonadales bacterium]|nr:methyltransferase [Xanthomonadales bacterium]
MKKISTMMLLLLISQFGFAANLPINARIEQAMLGDHRSVENQARNRYRHPLGTLSFFGLKDDMAVLEIWPGAGWYSEVLAPVLRDHGQYRAAVYDAAVAGQPDYRYGLNADLEKKLATNPELYDQVVLVPFSPPQSASLGEANSIDLIVTFRNTHGWIGDGVAAQVFA